jgi:hypothetical protein
MVPISRFLLEHPDATTVRVGLRKEEIIVE